jgi:S1-C subfamily serine protease
MPSKRWMIRFAALAALLFLAGCGGGDDDDDDSADAVETQEEDVDADDDGDGEATAEAEEVESGTTAEELAQSVVQIYHLEETSGRYEPLLWCSGTIIDPGGLILTNAHCTDEDQIGEYDALGIGLLEDPEEPTEPSYFAEVIEEDVDADVAILQITTDNEGKEVDTKALELPAATLGDPDDVELGDTVRIIGYPAIGAAPDEFFFSEEFTPEDVRVRSRLGRSAVSASFWART